MYPKEWDKYPDVKDKFPLKPHYLDGFTQDYPLMSKVKDDTDPDYYTVNFCEEQLQKAGERDKPLFLACGIVKPHLPWVVPQKYYDMYPKDEIIMPGGLADTTQRKRDLKDIPEPGIRGNNCDCGWFTRESDKIVERMEECKFRGGSHCPKTCGLCSG